MGYRWVSALLNIPNPVSDDRPKPVLPFTGQWEIESFFTFYLGTSSSPAPLPGLGSRPTVDFCDFWAACPSQTNRYCM